MWQWYHASRHCLASMVAGRDQRRDRRADGGPPADDRAVVVGHAVDCELPPTHLGWNGRLNGPVDNPMSSSVSCHAVPQVWEVSPISPLFQNVVPLPGSDEWMRWFQIYRCAQRFDKDARRGTQDSAKLSIAKLTSLTSPLLNRRPRKDVTWPTSSLP